MAAKKNNGSVLLKLGLFLVVVAVVAVFAFRSLQGVARVKVVNRDTAVDAVTGSVTIFADGGFKELKSEIGGRVLEADAINKGNFFKKGDPLVLLDTTDLDRQIAETERTYRAFIEQTELELQDNPEEKIAEENLENATRMLKFGAIAPDQVKATQRVLDAIRKRLRIAEFARKRAAADHDAAMEGFAIIKRKMTIQAPTDGQVLEPTTWEGALIGASQTVATIYSNERVVSAKISEENFGRLKVGQKARLRLLTYGEQLFEAKVSRLLPTADEAQRFEVWLEVKADSEQLKPRSTGEVTITVADRPNQVVIPRRALFGGDKVWVVKNGRVERRKVEIGFDSALNVVEILKGLEVGEQIIVDRLDEFHQGERVTVEMVN